jgi:predicted nucleotidyltransferase
MLHQQSAEIITDYFSNFSSIDTVLVVNSCARKQAVPESDLDFAILVKPATTPDEIAEIGRRWKLFEESQSTILKYKQSGPFAHLHLDIISGDYAPVDMGDGEPIDYFEIQIGNQVCHSAPMGIIGSYFNELQNKWLPYYEEKLRLKRLSLAKDACAYDLNHIPFLVRRGLYFHAFETLYKALQEYLQTLFISARIYPIAYNKWIKEQVAKWLNRPDLYTRLLSILSITNIESDEINQKANNLRILLNELS